MLVDANRRLLANPSDMEAKVDFVTTYHMVIEGTLALTGQDTLTRVFEGAGAATVDAAKQATAALYRQVILQATQLAYLDALIALGVTTALMVPLVWVANRPTPQGAPMVH